jgi:hypothetical protein
MKSSLTNIQVVKVIRIPIENSSRPLFKYFKKTTLLGVDHPSQPGSS